jgi:tyrosine phenol-lyase
MEPYKIKVCEFIKLIPRSERETVLKEAGYNVFMIPADKVYIDLLSDSGTSTMSTRQWASMLMGDESFSYQKSYYRLIDTVKCIFGFKHILPIHQGRAGEHILFSLMVNEGDYVPNNMHFETTRANIEHQGGKAVNIVVNEAYDTKSEFPFKGNIDLNKLRSLIEDVGKQRIPLCIITLTNNVGAGQPVSIENVREVKDILSKYNIPLFFDACRFAENAFLIREREQGYANKSIKEIVSELFSYADGCIMSAKKDILSNIGGFIAMNNGELSKRVENMILLIEGFPTHGGLAGRDLEAVAAGIEESIDEEHLAHRVVQVRYLGERLTNNGIPVFEPIGGHAVYIDTSEFLPHIHKDKFPSQALVAAIYLEGGVRTASLGSTFSNTESGHFLKLVRLSVPRRVYTREHLDYAVDVVTRVYEEREKIKGLKLIYEPKFLKDFGAKFDRL